MARDAREIDALLGCAAQGDEQALGELFSRYRGRMKRMVKLRLDRRLCGRIDPSDVVQEAFLEARKRLPELAEKRDLPVLLWLRLVTGQKLADLHRAHLGAKMRDAGREISFAQGGVPQASSMTLADQLLAAPTPPSRAAVRAEARRQVREALDSLSPLDRDVLALRHFEQLTNDETALALGIKRSAASNRYVRALARLKEVLSAFPELAESR